MKDCPDLTRLSPQERSDFWKEAEPSKLRRLGDRLLAESLPGNHSEQPREELAKRSLDSRLKAGLNLEEAADYLGLTPEIVQAWEEDRVHPPSSLPLIWENLKTKSTLES